MLSLSKHINIHQVRIKALSLITSKKRVSFSFPFIKMRASMTVEATFVVPIFLFYMMTILYSLEIVRFQSDVWEALHQVSTEKSFQAYEGRYGSHTGQTIDAKTEVNDYLARQILPYLCVKGKKRGISIIEKQNYMGAGNIKVLATYEIVPFIKWLPIGRIMIEDSCLVHGWVGYTEDDYNEQYEKAIYVYITPSGEKYHYSEDCTYLKVQVMVANMQEIATIRNASGEIYYNCELCKPKGQTMVFYTKWGNRYHSQSDCQALRRTIYIVSLAEVENRTVCNKCEKKK